MPPQKDLSTRWHGYKLNCWILYLFNIVYLSKILFTFLSKVRLRDSLFSTLKFSKAKDAQLAWLDGVIKMTDDERTDLKPLEEEEGEELRSKPEIPMLNPLPEESVQVRISTTDFFTEWC